MKLLLDEKNLARQPLFWIAIFIPVSLFFLFSYPLWQHSTLALNKNAYQNFLESYKLPLYLLGICVPLVAIIVSMHRTIQTEKQILHTKTQLENNKTQLENTLKQIDITETKNKSDSYYSHVKFIIEALNSLNIKTIDYLDAGLIIGKESLKIVQPYALYKRVFSKSNIENGYSTEINKFVSETLDHHFARINFALKDAAQAGNNWETKIGSLIIIDASISKICHLFYLDYNPNDHLFIATGDVDMAITSFNSETQIKKLLGYLYHTAQQIADITGLKTDHLEISATNEVNAELRYYITYPENIYFGGLLSSNRRAFRNNFLGERRPKNGGKVAT